MSMDMPGGYLGQGRRTPPDRRVLTQHRTAVPIPITEEAEERYPSILSTGGQVPSTQVPDGRVIREIAGREPGGEPLPRVGTRKQVPYPATSQLLLPDVAPTSKTVQYPVPDPPTSLGDRAPVTAIGFDNNPIARAKAAVNREVNRRMAMEPDILSGKVPLPDWWRPTGTPMTGAQEQAIRMAEERPTAGQIVGPVANRLRDAQVQSDANWQASNKILDTRARALAADRPDIADQALGVATEYGLEAARQNRQWDQDYNRLIAVQTDPNGAMMFEQYQLGQIPGYQITSNPNVSPYWKKLVAEEPIGRNPARYGNIVREGTASRRGMSADYLESEADRQIGGVVDRMVRGGGNKAMRSAMQAYARAIRETTKYAPGTKEHQDALDAETEASLKVQQSMGGMLAKFEDRMGREGGDVVKGSAWGMVDRAIRDRVQGALGQAQQPGTAPQQQPQTRPQSPTRGTRGQQEPPTTPVVRKTLSNQTVEQFATPEVYFATVMSGKYTPPPGGAIQVGKEVYLPGLNYKPDGSTTPTLRPAIALGDYYVSDPRSFAGKNSAEQKAAWAAQLTDDERRDLFRAFVVEGADSTLPAEIRKQLRAVYRSRLGVNTSPLSEKDQSQALMGLKAREDDVLYAALVGFPGAREPRFQGEIEAPEEAPTSGGRGGSSRPVVGGKPAPKFKVPVLLENGRPNPNGAEEEVKMPNFESVWKQLSEQQQVEFNYMLQFVQQNLGQKLSQEFLDEWDRSFGTLPTEGIQSSDFIDRVFDPILNDVKDRPPRAAISQENWSKRPRSVSEIRGRAAASTSPQPAATPESEPQAPPAPDPAPRLAPQQQPSRPSSPEPQAAPANQGSVLTRPQQPPPPASDDRTTTAIIDAKKFYEALGVAESMGPEHRRLFLESFPDSESYRDATNEKIAAFEEQLERLSS
jgi:hypothetical protein